MNRLLSASLLVVGLTQALAFGYNSKLYVADVRNTWGRWDAAITMVDWRVTIDGLMARNQVTMVFQDTLSSNSSDSLEVSFNFDLVDDAVVDSLYLWIGETMQPALILKKEQAQQIYEGIVNRRRDPALLIRNGTSNNYDLKIFPLARHGSRMVRLCYWSPLKAAAGKLSVDIPLQITGQSYYPVASVDVSVLHTYALPTNVQVTLPQGLTLSQWQQSGSGTLVVTRGRNVRPCGAMSVSSDHGGLSTTGMAVQFCRESAGEAAFYALLDPARMTGYTGASGRFYPANLGLDGAHSGFVYDMFGPLVTSYATGETVALFGKLHNDNSLAVSFNGVLGGRDYSYRGFASADAVCTTDRGVSALWAWHKVAGLIATGTPAQEATDLSFAYHILTQYTALLALEPSMLPGIADGQNPGSNPGGVLTAVGDAPQTARVQPGLTVETALGAVTIVLGNLGAAERSSLCIYDLTGKLVADLSSQLQRASRVTWNTRGVAPGMYVIRLVVNGKVLSARVSVGR
jgi:hypothetical protein